MNALFHIHKSPLKKLALFLIAALVLLAGFAFSQESAQAASCTKYHTVQRGETLYLIGLKYNRTWDKIAKLNHISNSNKIYAGQVLCIFADGTPSSSPYQGSIPFITITSVVQDESVTLSATNFPAYDTFTVRMGAMGTKGINGVKAGTVSSGKTGVFTAKFNIPASLKGSYRIAIRLESPTSGYYSYNWFYNNTTGAPGTPSPNKPYQGYPTFSIQSVIRDTSVTIKTNNFPADDTFVVRMGAMGTKGINGVKVATIDSDNGGAFTATFDIPSSLKGSYRIAIRLESPSSGYYAYNWFYNNTTK